MRDQSAPTPVYDFSGSIAIHYDQFLGPLYFEPYAIEIARRIDPAAVVHALEIASGTGRVTRHLRERIPASASLIASDISSDMLAVASEKLKHLNIDWQTIDAERLPFNDNSFDLVVCCFGYMFVPDKPTAFAEAYRVLNPGGLLLFTTWDKLEENAASCIYRKSAEKYLGALHSEFYNLPFSMNDEILIRSYLQAAGFSTIKIEKVKLDSISSTAKEAVNALSQGGHIHNEIMGRNPAWMDEIRVLVEKEFSEKFGTAPMIAPMCALVSQAWK